MTAGGVNAPPVLTLFQRKHEMLLGSELALDRATIERSRNRESAIMAKAVLQGYKFIRLQLKNIRRRKICGIDAIMATDFTNDAMGGITDHYLEVKGGEINFEFRPELGMYVFDMLDTDRNRQFLATHLAGDYWEILDKRVEADVVVRASEITRRLRETPKSAEPNDFWKEVHASEAQAIRAARGEVDIPGAPIAAQDQIKPMLPPVIKRTEPIANSQEALPAKVPAVMPNNVRPNLWKKKPPSGNVVVSHETFRTGVGVVAP
jgi:hypothetical protein